MKCADASDMFIDHADQALLPQNRLALEAHLACCPECAARWRDYRQTIHLLHSLQPAEPPADLLAGITAQLEARKSMSQRILDLLDHISFPVPLPAAIAVFAIAMFAGYLSQHPLLPAQPNSTPAATVARRAAIPSMPPKTMFAMAHAQQPTVPQLILETHSRGASSIGQSPGGRLLSPDLMIDIHHLHRQQQAQLCREFIERRWQVRHTPHGLLVQLPANRLVELHALLGDHPYSLAPKEAARPDFGGDKPLLTALVHFH